MIRADRPVLPCPACGFVVVSEGYGGYEICDICGWEDDPVQLANPTSGGGANQESLAEAQAAAMRIVPLGVDEHLGFQRDSGWRPLSPSEIQLADARKQAEHWHTDGITDPAAAYWRT
jgi:hypothetical protein